MTSFPLDDLLDRGFSLLEFLVLRSTLLRQGGKPGHEIGRDAVILVMHAVGDVVKLQGVITWFDSFCVLLRRDGQSQLVYKHAISTVMPGQPISLYEGEEG